MWVDVQKGCGMGLGGYADLRVPSFVHTTLHTMHTILHTIFGHSVQGGEKALEKAHKREKTRKITCTLQ